MTPAIRRRMDTHLHSDRPPQVWRYKGWVPVVSGYLSFTVIGDTSHPRQTENANVADRNSRYIVCSQLRPASDAAFPRLATWLPRRRAGGEKGIYRERDLWFLCVAHCDKTQAARALAGHVFVFTTSLWQRMTLHVNAAQSRLRSLDNAGRGLLDKSFSTEYARLLEICRDRSVASCSFQLERNGEFLLALAEAGAGRRAVQVEFEPAETSQTTENMHEDLAAQLYYFIRDLAHRHQHHDAESDQLTTIYPFDASSPLKDRYTWLRHTYYQLMRQIISWKRLQGDDDLAAATGMLCYARSLVQIAKNECDRCIANRPADEKECKEVVQISAYVDEHLEKSIKAKSESKRNKIQLNLSNTAWRTSVAALFVSIFVANISIVNMAKGGSGYETSELYKMFANTLATHPVHVNILIFLFVYCVIIWSRRPSQQFRIEKAIMRLVMAFPNIQAARVTMLLIGAGLLSGGIYAAHRLRDWITLIGSMVG